MEKQEKENTNMTVGVVLTVAVAILMLVAMIPAMTISHGSDAEPNLLGMGQGSYGKMGTGGTDDVLVPTQIGSFTNVTDVVCSNNTTFFIDSAKLYGMGQGTNGKMGTGGTDDVLVPTQIGSFTNVTDVVCSSNTTFFLLPGGEGHGIDINTVLIGATITLLFISIALVAVRSFGGRE